MYGIPFAAQYFCLYKAPVLCSFETFVLFFCCFPLFENFIDLGFLYVFSVYAVSKLNRFGLVVINLPFGVLITSHRHPVTSAVASDFVENAAGLLRM